MAATTFDEYLASFPPDAQRALMEMQALIRQAAPEATETISYGMPTFHLNGHPLVHFAGYKEHVGFYSITDEMEASIPEITPYRSGKVSARFPLAEPLPADLIRRLVQFRAAEIAPLPPKVKRKRKGT